MTFCRISLIFYEELCMKQFSMKNKSCKVLFSSDVYSYCKYNKNICTPNSLKFEPLYLKFFFLHFLDIEGSYLHAVVTFYTYLLGISSDEMVMWIIVTVILIFIEFSVMWPGVKTRFKITLTVYMFVLLLEQEDVLYHVHICFIFLY